MKHRISKKDILKLLLLAAIIVAADRGLFAGFSRLFDKLETVGLSEMVNSQAEIVVFGSSRACHHYESEVIENITGKSTYNIGRDGLGVPYTRGACDVLLKSYCPKTIVIEVGPKSIMTRSCGNQLKRVSRLAPYIDQSDVVKEMILSQGPQHKYRYMSKAFRFNGLPMYVFYDITKRDKFVKGYEALDKVYDPTYFRLPVNAGKGFVQSDLNEDCVRLLIDTIRSAKENGAEVILVTSPRWGGFAGYESDERECFAFIEQLAKEHGASYIAVMQEDYPHFADASLFADVDHLNRQGARVFSEIIADILIEKTTPSSR